MNELHKEIFDSLMALVSNDECFYFNDQILKNRIFRIFDYRLASYSQWLNPHATQCRGITFEVDDNGNALELVSWPFEKYWNIRENPFTMDVDLNDPMEILYKIDGSLMATIHHEDVDDGFWLKSKGSLFSDHAIAANKIIRDDKHKNLFDFVKRMVLDGYTVIMEYTSPEHRIVVPVDEPGLTILGIRNIETGKYLDLDSFRTSVDVAPYLVENIKDMVDDVNEFVSEIPDMTGFEGFVIRLNNGQRIKIKTNWYMKLHHIKDSINSTRRLYEAVVYDTVDDVRAQFWDDAQAIGRIDDMEELVGGIYNHMVDQVERFYKRNNHLSQKEFAMKAQKELETLHFHIAMAMYNGKEIDYREIMVKNRKKFGIMDDDPDDGEE